MTSIAAYQIFLIAKIYYLQLEFSSQNASSGTTYIILMLCLLPLLN
jgi:hypothetical protein